MRTAYVLALAIGLGSMSCLSTGCQTSQPGATYTLGAYTAMVDASPDKVTTAAAKAADDLKLVNVNSSGTKIDGQVTARTAQDQPVTISIDQAGDNVSKVTIRVGDT